MICAKRRTADPGPPFTQGDGTGGRDRATDGWTRLQGGAVRRGGSGGVRRRSANNSGVRNLRTKTDAGRLLPWAVLLLLIPALLPALFGCAGRRPALPSPPGDLYASPEQALRALEASAPGDQTLTVTARIEIRSDGQRHLLKAAIMLKRPEQLRLVSFPVLGPPDFYLSIDAGELRVFSPGTDGGVFYTGRATARNILRFFPLALPAADMVSLLTGHPPHIVPASLLQGQWDEGLYRVDRYLDGERALSIWIDPQGDRLRRVQAFLEGGAVAYTAELADHAPLGAGYVPRRVTLSTGSASLTLRYTEYSLARDEEPFALPVPEGVAPVSLD